MRWVISARQHLRQNKSLKALSTKCGQDHHANFGTGDIHGIADVIGLIKSYLEMNKYHPVTFGDEGGAVNPEEAKVMAMQDFVEYIRGMAGILHKKAYIKNEIGNKFIPDMPSIGFSDDDIKNVEVMKKHFKDKPDNIVKTYSTAGGIKKEYK